jgi:hypothetical protein
VGFTCTPNPVATAQLPPVVTQAVEPVVSAAIAKSSITYLPKWYGSAGGGTLIPGSSKFAYQAVAVFVGQASYLTAVTEYTFLKGQVQSCTLGGVSKVLYQFGAFSVGTTGLGGGCSTTTTSGGAAAAVQGFGSFHIGKGGFSVVATGDKTFTTDGRQGAKITLGIAYGK